jgi:hypothetical protein
VLPRRRRREGFALPPWLTVQQNVELGLEARGVAADVADELGLDVDDLFPTVDGLDLLGFATVDTNGVALTDTGR